MGRANFARTNVSSIATDAATMERVVAHSGDGKIMNPDADN